MSLQLNVSNSLENLAGKLSTSLNKEHDIFVPFNVVTQTTGMNNWLKIVLAGKLGITANIRFKQPNDIINQIFFLLGGRFREVLNKDHLTWLLFKILGEYEFIHQYPSVSSYYDNDEPDREIKRFSLAKATADLFDQYQIYRPEMISKWNLSSIEVTDNVDWQMYLWIRACILSVNALPDKTKVSDYILNELQNPAQCKLLQHRFPSIHIFGLSIITNYHLQVMYELSKIIDVFFYLLNPAPCVYFFEDKNEKQIAILKNKGYSVEHLTPGNQLLLNWGRITQDTFNIFFRIEEFINAYQEVQPVEPGKASLLQKIQHDIFLNKNHTERDPIAKSELLDGSISINSCYTIAREVEALYNFLVHIVQTKETSISARDIIVMVPDIDSYAPYIKAVFNNAPYKFPYAIADESIVSGDSLISAIKSILVLDKDNFTSEAVLQLLDHSYIRNRFKITDLNMIRKIVIQANIRFGIEGELHDDTRYVSWSYGIKRIIYGICMSGEPAYSLEDTTLYPLDRIEGASSLEMIRFCHFVDVLIDSLKAREYTKSLSDWVTYTERLVSDLVYEPTEDPDEDYNEFVEQLEKLNALNTLVPEKVSFKVFRHDFVHSFSEITSSGSFAMGGITFCSLIPMRSIPSKIVAVLGLNFDKFPRKNPIHSFSKIEAEKRKGDRNIKENDKHLFLETLLSAQEHLYLSYIGQSTKDNSAIPPSILVDELIDYIIVRCEDEQTARQLLTVIHPLNSFSPKYNSSDNRLFSYFNEQSSNINLIRDVPKQAHSNSYQQVSLASLISFLKNPFKGYYNDVLGIYYQDEQILVEETEIFELDNLQKWKLKNILLSKDEEQIELMVDKMAKTGELPLKNMGKVTLENTRIAIVPVKALFEKCCNGQPEREITLSLEIGETIISGTLNSIFGDNLIFVSFSKKNDNKYLVDAAIRYVFARAAGAEIQLSFVSSEKNKIFYGSPISEKRAKIILENLLGIYRAGHEKIICFDPEFQIKPSDINTLDFERFTKKVNEKLDNGKFPCEDKYIMREYNNGFFTAEESFEQYKEYGGTILSVVAEVLPNYHN